MIDISVALLHNEMFTAFLVKINANKIFDSFKYLYGHNWPGVHASSQNVSILPKNHSCQSSELMICLDKQV